MIRNSNYNQMVMSSGHYFGDNTYLDENFFDYSNIYAHLYEHLLTTKHNRKEKLHVELQNQNTYGYYD